MLLHGFELLDLIDVLSMFVATVFPAYFVVRATDRSIKTMSFLLTGFTFFHGLYHLAFLLGEGFFAAVLLGPMSILFLIVFGVYYLRKELVPRG